MLIPSLVQSELFWPEAEPRTALASSEGDLAGSLSGGTLRLLAAKDHAFSEGDPVTHVYRIEIGHICLYRVLPDGRRKVVNFAFPGDLIGLCGNGHHTESAQATDGTRLTAFPIATVHETARKDPLFAKKLFEAMSLELTTARDLLVALTQRTACERLASFLLALARRHHWSGELGNEIVLPMSRSDIADFLGLSIETVSRTFTKFRLEGLIEIEQFILVTILDQIGLERVAGFRSFQRRDITLASSR